MAEKQKDRYLCVKQVAEMLGCHDKVVFDLIKDGHITAIRIGQRALRISENSLNKFIESRKVDPQDYFV